MILRWAKSLTEFIQRGYNTFLYRASASDTVGPTVVYGMAGR